jgi:metal-sulfur cluster biosynthetic enzyme
VNGSASDADPLRETADATWKVLEGIIDPCSRAAGAPAGLVSMGLVRDVTVSGSPGAAIVNVELGITEPGCMMQGIFSAAAEREIRALPGVADVAVRIDHGYVWDPDDMAADYRARLSTVRAKRRLQTPPAHRSSP